MTSLIPMWNPFRLLLALAHRPPKHEVAIEHRERWHARVQRLSPRDEAPVEFKPYVPPDDVGRRDPTPRTEVRQLPVRPNASKLAPEDLERRVHEEGNGHERPSTV